MLQSPTATSWLKVSPLEVLITRACEPSLHEPNYALHLEVAEYINNKKANTPREAGMAIARLANHRNPHIAILALSLLDTLVQSCGYPFHLQISTKEFLNELVRRFPERPPPFPGPVMSRILDLIHGWKEGICVDSRWKEDLGNIRDMHRLLTFKGYRFKDVHKTTNAATAVTANLKTAEELEEEDRAAQSAKLQELIRRGTPRDLAAAQELMKSLAGANPDAKPDYRSQALTELNKLEQKVILLNEMLENVDTERGENFASGDAYDQVSSILIAARPKLQKWISDAETDDPESLDTFLQINDQINAVLTRYEAFKKGDYSAAPGGSSSGGAGGPSLIDLDDGEAANIALASTANSTPANDLSDLFLTGSSHQPSIQQSFRPVMTMGNLQQQQLSQQSQPQTFSPTPVFANGGFSGSSVSALQQLSHASTPPASIMLPSTPGPQRGTPIPVSQLSSYYQQVGGMKMPHGAQPAFGGAGVGSNPLLGVATQGQRQLTGTVGGSQQLPQSFGFGVPLQHHPQAQQTSASTSSTPGGSSTQQNKDPFADLAGLF